MDHLLRRAYNRCEGPNPPAPAIRPRAPSRRTAFLPRTLKFTLPRFRRTTFFLRRVRPQGRPAAILLGPRTLTIRRIPMIPTRSAKTATIALLACTLCLNPIPALATCGGGGGGGIGGARTGGSGPTPSEGHHVAWAGVGAAEMLPGGALGGDWVPPSAGGGPAPRAPAPPARPRRSPRAGGPG